MPDTAEGRERLARLEENMRILSKAVEGLTVEVKVLTAALNRGRGAFGFAMLFVSGFTALIVKLVDRVA